MHRIVVILEFDQSITYCIVIGNMEKIMVKKSRNLVEKKSQPQNPRNTFEYLLLEFSLYSSTNIINPSCHELIMMYKLYFMFMNLTNISLHSNTKIINQLFIELTHT